MAKSLKVDATLFNYTLTQLHVSEVHIKISVNLSNKDAKL